MGDEFFDAGIGDGGFVGDLVEGATVLDGSEKGLSVCHDEFRGWGGVLSLGGCVDLGGWL